MFVASGYHDLATPYFATDYTFSHLGLDPSLRDHIVMETYEGGHLMYLYKPTLQKMKADISRFIKHRLDKRQPSFSENRIPRGKVARPIDGKIISLHIFRSIFIHGKYKQCCQANCGVYKNI